MVRFIAVLTLSALGATAAVAQDDHNFRGDHDFGDHSFHHGLTAPEIDPSSALSALTLLCGGLAVLRGRMSKK